MQLIYFYKKTGFFLLIFIITIAAKTAEMTNQRSGFNHEKGHRVVLATPPLRIISLTPNVTELAFSAGLHAQLIAVSRYSDYPQAAQLLPQIADANGVNLEQLMLLKPDLILTWQGMTSQSILSKFDEYNIPVVVLTATTLDDLANVIEQLSHLSLHPEIAIQSIVDVQQKLAEITHWVESQNHAIHSIKSESKTVFLQFSQTPLITTNKQSLQGQIVTLCGAKNSFANSMITWPQVNIEEVVISKPDVIVMLSDKKDTFKHDDQFQYNRVVEFWRPYLPNAKIITLSADEFSRESPRILDAAQTLCRALR